MARFRMVVVALGVGVLGVACKQNTDLGGDCVLTKGDDAGDPRGVPIVVGDLSANQDFVSFASTDCSDLTCVLNADAIPAAITAANADPLHHVKGYCSQVCSVNSDCAVQINDQQNTPGLAMNCRDLLLSTETLSAICADPNQLQLCEELGRSSTFCARGASPDGGT